MMKLYNIFYIDYPDYTPKYECTTDNPKKWLEKHNKDRVADDQVAEKVDEFDVQEITPVIFNKDNRPCHYCKKGEEHREFDGFPTCDDCVNKLYYDEEGNRKYKDDEIPVFIKENK